MVVYIPLKSCYRSVERFAVVVSQLGINLKHSFVYVIPIKNLFKTCFVELYLFKRILTCIDFCTFGSKVTGPIEKILQILICQRTKQPLGWSSLGFASLTHRTNWNLVC